MRQLLRMELFFFFSIKPVDRQQQSTVTNSVFQLFLMGLKSQHYMFERKNINLKFKANTKQFCQLCSCHRGWIDLQAMQLQKHQQGWWQASSAGFKDVESAVKHLPTFTQGEPTGTNNVKQLPSDSHQDILSDYWCQQPINYSLYTLFDEWSFWFFRLLTESKLMFENISLTGLDNVTNERSYN